MRSQPAKGASAANAGFVTIAGYSSLRAASGSMREARRAGR